MKSVSKRPLNTIAKRLLAASLLAGILFDALFYDRPLGLSVPLFVCCLLIMLAWLAHSKGLRMAGRNRWLLLPLLLAAVFVAVRDNPFLTFLNLVAVFCLLALVAHFYNRGNLVTLSLPGYAAVLFSVPLKTLYTAAPLVSSSLDDLDMTLFHRGRTAAIRVGFGFLLAAPIILIFTLLLRSADVVFATMLGRLLNADILPVLREGLQRSGLILGLAWVVAGGLVYALLRGADTVLQELETGMVSLRGHLSLGMTESGIILGLVNALFLLFVWVQFAFFFTGRSSGLPEGFTYAEYARRGFFELVAVAALSLLVLVSLEWLTRRTGRRAHLLHRLLNSMMVVLVLVILGSAFRRLSLYEQAFGYTELRLYVHVFMAWLGLLLAWVLALVWWGAGRLLPAREGKGPAGLLPASLFVFSLCFLFTLNMINPDAIIAAHNLGRYQETGKLDAYYLTTLSDDAVPNLVAALPTLAEEDRAILCHRLEQRYTWLQDHPQSLQWPAFQLSNFRAFQALNTDLWTELCLPIEND